MSSPDDRQPMLLRQLGLYTAVAVVVGSMIGSGIFKKSARMAESLDSPELLMVGWILAGAVTCFGALSNAEVAGMFPEAGGQYVFFRRIYNRFVEFLYGWAIFAVIQTGSIASIAYVFAEYLGHFAHLPVLAPALDGYTINLFGFIPLQPLHDLGVKGVTVATIVTLTAVNVLGVRFGGTVQSVLTTIKVAAVAGMVLLVFGLGGGDVGNFTEAGPGAVKMGGGLLALVAGMGIALSGAFWSYDGWNNITFLAGEVRDPERNLPRALFVGTATVVGVYLLVNLAYLYMIPLGQMSGSKLIARDVMEKAMGPAGAALISALVMVSTFGSTNGSILASSRVSFAMASDGLFFSPLARVHPRFSTPAVALGAQCLWACVLVFSGSFDQLTDMLIFVSWIFYALAAAGVFVLRRKLPNQRRPYRVWGYPVVPAVFVLFASAYVVVTLMQNTRDTALGLLLVVLGIPLYLWKVRGSSQDG